MSPRTVVPLTERGSMGWRDELVLVWGRLNLALDLLNVKQQQDLM